MSFINGQKQYDNITLTAEVLITLSSLYRLTGEAKTIVQNTRNLAANYLGGMLPHIENPFSMAITAHALTMAGHQDRGTAFLKLRKMKREGKYIQYRHLISAPVDQTSASASLCEHPWITCQK